MLPYVCTRTFNVSTKGEKTGCNALPSFQYPYKLQNHIYFDVFVTLSIPCISASFSDSEKRFSLSFFPWSFINLLWKPLWRMMGIEHFFSSIVSDILFCPKAIPVFVFFPFPRSFLIPSPFPQKAVIYQRDSLLNVELNLSFIMENENILPLIVTLSVSN